MNLGDWRGQPVLVTGAAGFIGSHLVERLAQMGAHVRAYVHDNSRSDWGWLDRLSPLPNGGSLERHAGDLADHDHVKGAVSGMRTVFHLGAQISIPKSYAEPGLFISSNVIGTFNVLAACRESGVERMVLASTSEVYGSARYLPMDEEHPLQAQSPYAATKIAAEKLVESYHRSFGTPGVVLRPFNTFGPRQSARAIIPTIISQALWSDTIELGSIAPLRDFNYVSNTVDAFLAAASAPGVEGQVFNAGSGRSVTMGEVAEMACRLIGRDLPVVSREERVRPETSEVDRRQANPERATATLGWKPKVTLEEGLERTVAWIAEHPLEFNVGSYAI
jgi:nucleoside-diphosphate-sugar epimerase